MLLDENNALVLKSANSEQTLTFAAPALCDEIQLLTISANGQSNLKVVVNYEDGTTSDAVRFTPEDWFGGSNGTAVYGLQRIITNERDSYKADQIDNRPQLRCFEHAITTDGSKNVKSLTFTSTKSGSYPTVLAVSRTGRKSGVENIPVENGEREVVAVYNLQGIQAANAAAPGVYIIRYSDGTAEKVVIR